MPYMFSKNQKPFKKPKYQVTNWPEYNVALRNRGDITIWLTDEAQSQWTPKKSDYQGMGRPRKFSDIAIKTSIMIRQVFSLTLRATQGFMRSLAKLLGLKIAIPDYTVLSRRSENLKVHRLTSNIEPGCHVIVDSTGLKVYGKDEWHQVKHKIKPKRTWRKLHLAIDENQQIIATELTTNKVGDGTVLPDLLDKLEHNFETFMADGGYDGQPTYDLINHVNPSAQVTIKPPKNSLTLKEGNTQRNAHIDMIRKNGRGRWRIQTGYGRRSLVEVAMLRYKTIIGNKMKARKLSRQIAEAQISVRVLNRMTQLGMPATVRVT